MGWYDHGSAWGGWIWMTLMMLMLGALLVFGAVLVYRSGRRDDNVRRPTSSQAEELLAARFARGEIDADEYTQRRELLRSGH